MDEVLGEMTNHGHVLGLAQFHTEEILYQKAIDLGVEINWNHHLTTITQNVEHVTIEFEVGEEKEKLKLKSKWVVACDGAKGDIRHHLGVTNKEGYDLQTTVVMARIQIVDLYQADGDNDNNNNNENVAGNKDDHNNENNKNEGGNEQQKVEKQSFEKFRHSLLASLTHRGIIMVAPEGDDYFRVICEYPHEFDAQIADSPPLELFQEIINDRMPFLHVQLTNPLWLVKFNPRQRMVTSFRKGRVLFAGDSAHSHSPAGGMGMNTGFQDTYNLGWKLGLVVKGIGRSELLDSYAVERDWIATKLLNQTKQSTKMAMNTPHSKFAVSVRNRILSSFVSVEVVRKTIVKNMGMLDLNYRSSPYVGEFKASSSSWSEYFHGFFNAAPKPGDRMSNPIVDGEGNRRLMYEVEGTHHSLLFFSGEEEGAAYETILDAIIDAAAYFKSTYSPYLRTYFVSRSLLTQFDVTNNVLNRRAININDNNNNNNDNIEVVEVDDDDGKRQQLRKLESLFDRVFVDEHNLIHSAYGATSNCSYLIRPDKYIGFRSYPHDTTAVIAHLSKIFY